jgi:hypothetical protein
VGGNKLKDGASFSSTNGMGDEVKSFTAKAKVGGQSTNPSYPEEGPTRPVKQGPELSYKGGGKSTGY